MNKVKQIVEKVVVTFVEAALVYMTVVPHVTMNRALLAGAIGAGLSAVYNLLRESTPTMNAVAAVPVAPVPLPQTVLTPNLPPSVPTPTPELNVPPVA